MLFDNNAGYPDSVSFSKRGGRIELKGDAFVWLDLEATDTEFIEADGFYFPNDSCTHDTITLRSSWLTVKVPYYGMTKIILICEPNETGHSRKAGLDGELVGYPNRFFINIKQSK